MFVYVCVCVCVIVDVCMCVFRVKDWKVMVPNFNDTSVFLLALSRICLCGFSISSEYACVYNMCVCVRVCVCAAFRVEDWEVIA